MGKGESLDLANGGGGDLLTHPSFGARTISGDLVGRHSGLGWENQGSLEP